MKDDLSFSLDQLSKAYSLAESQFRSWQRFSLIAASIGLGVVITSMLLALFWPTSFGFHSFLPPMVQSIVSALAFGQMHAARRQIDAVRAEMINIRCFELALQATTEIEDARLRDKAITDLVHRRMQQH